MRALFICTVLLLDVCLQSIFSQSYCDPTTVNGTVGEISIGQILFNEFALPYSGNYTNNYSLLDSNAYGVAKGVKGQKYHIGYGNGNTSGLNINAISVWIDWNNDGNFDNTLHSSGGERLNTNYTAGTNSRYWDYFTIPLTAATGLVRVRVRNIYVTSTATIPDPCFNYNYGSTMDFYLNIQDEMGPQTPVYGNANLVQLTNYTDLYINQVVLGSINHSSAYFGDNNLHCNYSNFMHYSTNLEEGQTYTLATSHSFTGFSATTGAWIDFNQDGDFNDPNERLGVIHNLGTIKNFTFTVPAGIQAQRVALRVRVVDGDQSSTLTATNNYANGTFPWAYNETEDYSVWLVPDVILPVDLISFEGESKKDFNLLQWSTASEKNAAYFTLERSSDGIHYQEIGLVPANGNSTQTLKYSFSDYFTDITPYYYQLYQYDFDGKKHQKGIVLLKPIETITSDIKIFPNPAVNHLNISVSEALSEIVIFNDLGQIIDLQPSFQNNIYTFNTQNIPNGVYYIKLTNHSKEIKNMIVTIMH